MLSSLSLLLTLGASVATAQQYSGDTISAYLPTIPGAEIAFFKIPDTDGKNDNLTLINYYGLGTDNQRIGPSKIQRAVIVLHGLLRDPWDYANDTFNALDLATAENSAIDKDTVAIMAPYFPNGDDKGYGYPWTEGLSGGEGSTSNALVWSGSQWSAGANNHYPHSSRSTSSFYVLDTLIQYFDNTTIFPNLKEIVLVGHSLGGQMLQRYAAIGDVLDTNSPVTLWVGNPSSYVWLNEERPLYTDDCEIYDNYREGFTNFTEYPMSYGESLVNAGRSAILDRYNSKRIAYARGIYDHGNEASTCAGPTQGGDRNERFFFFIKAFQPSCSGASSRDCDTVDLIPASHDNGQMFKSDAGLARLFTDNWAGDGTRAYDFGYPREQEGDDPFPDPSQANNTYGATIFGEWNGNMTYQGCWADQYPLTDYALPTLLYDNSGNSIEGCTSGCYNAGYTIAGLQNSTQCYCGNALNQVSAVLVVDSSCQLACPGNSYEVCGGNNRLSLFSESYPTFS